MSPDLVVDRFADLHANGRAELKSAAVRAHLDLSDPWPPAQLCCPSAPSAQVRPSGQHGCDQLRSTAVFP